MTERNSLIIAGNVVIKAGYKAVTLKVNLLYTFNLAVAQKGSDIC